MLKNKIAYIGMTVGALALMLSLIHFWAGPFAPQPSLETAVAESAVEIRDATIRALKVEDARPKQMAGWNLDRTINVATASRGGIAIILSIIGFAKHEPRRPVLASAALGIGAITFQFLAWFAVALLVAVLIYAVLQNFGGIVGLD